MNIVLVRFRSDGERRDYPLNGERAVLGREKHCDLTIPDSSVSRRHCELVVEDGRLVVRDLGSRNGTYHNERTIEGDEPVEPGDRIAVGPIIFTVQIDGEPDHIEPPLMDAPATGPKSGGTSASGDHGGQQASSDDSAAEISDLIAQVQDDSDEFDVDSLLEEEQEPDRSGKQSGQSE